ncbi:hypothetical protein RUM43_011537 [Polyplax serrata]|uniref:Uncharacterized protein n=1 Tax=Polyplax serrata TaxID=468196 RepID=A0AAN8P825_POLSC
MIISTDNSEVKWRLTWRTFSLLLTIGCVCDVTVGQYSENRYGNSHSPWYSPPTQNLDPRAGPYQGIYPNPDTFHDGGQPHRDPQPRTPENPHLDNQIFSAVHKYDVVTPSADGNDRNTPLYGGTIDGQIRLERARSPYLVQEDVIIERNGEMVIEPGVMVKFSPMVGLTVRGILNIQVSHFKMFLLWQDLLLVKYYLFLTFGK